MAIGYDEGSILIKLGREEPAMSMDSSGKIIWAKHCEVQQANLKAIGNFFLEKKVGCQNLALFITGTAGGKTKS